jgi:tRNA dimethylallyltransferase
MKKITVEVHPVMTMMSDINEPSAVKTLIIIAGPTAVGKTRFAIDLAKELNTVILSADSRQFYRETHIGTAKPAEEELNEVKHYFINSLSISEDYNAGRFEQDALTLLKELFTQHNHVIVCGGTGLYIKALTEGLDDLPSSAELRTELTEKYNEHGLTYLQERLKNRNPERYAQLDAANPHRLMRAIEIEELREGKSNKNKAKRFFSTLYFVLDLPREELYHRINQRVDEMIISGLEEEARNLWPQRQLNALQTVGYQEWFDCFEGKHTREECINLIKQHTRNFAKRQLTWFRKIPEAVWLHPSELSKVIALVRK